MHHTEHIPWQRAVYLRRSPNEDYLFSHVERTTVRKMFARSLSVQDIAEQPRTNHSNLTHLRQEPVLILVTGNWAEEYALDHLEAMEDTDHPPNHHTRTNQFRRRAPPCNTVRYDHLQRLYTHSPKNAELATNYYSMEYYSTMAQFTADASHRWRLASVIPFLSDIVVLPRTIATHARWRKKARVCVWRPIMRAFQRAVTKGLKDSIFITGGARYKENTLEMVSKPPLPTLENSQQ